MRGRVFMYLQVRFAERSHPVHRYRKDNEEPDKGPLPERGNPQKDQTVPDNFNQRRSDDGTEDCSGTAKEIGSSDHCGSNHGQFH